MGKKLTVVSVMAILLFSGACATIGKLIQKPTITFDSLGTRDMSLLAGTFLFRFNVANPNPLGIHVSDILYDLDINGERFISNRLEQGLDLIASGTAPLEIPVTINYLKVFNSLAKLRQSDGLDYRLTGSAGVGPMRIPYQTTGRIDIPKLPDITVERIKIDRFDFTGTALKLVLGMKNSNAFDMKMDGLEYSAMLGDVELAKGVARQIPPLAGNGQATMDLGVNLNFLQLGRSVRALLSGASAPCRLMGNMLVDTRTGMEKIPFRFNGQVPFIR